MIRRVRRRGGVVGLLTILFIGLKLTGHIDWSWWWVLSPVWISVAAMLLIFFPLAVLVVASERRGTRR